MLRPFICAALLCLPAAAASAQAQVSALLDSDAVLESRAVSLAAGAHSVSLQVPVPVPDGVRFGVLRDAAPAGGGIAAYSFHTPEQTLIESVHLSTASIPTGGDPQARLETFRGLLRSQAVPALQEALPGLAVETTRNMQVAGLDAVELTGTATHPTHGPLRWRLLGVLNPEGAVSLYTLSQVATSALPVTGPENFGQSLSGRMLRTLRYD